MSGNCLFRFIASLGASVIIQFNTVESNCLEFDLSPVFGIISIFSSPFRGGIYTW
jgi:hypothetical protein